MAPATGFPSLSSILPLTYNRSPPEEPSVITAWESRRAGSAAKLHATGASGELHSWFSVEPDWAVQAEMRRKHGIISFI